MTVMISVLGILLMGLPFLHGLAVGTSLAVFVAVLAAITLLPALLGFAGTSIDRFRVGRRKQRDRETMWHRWARVVQRRPGVIALAGFVVLFVLAAPALALRLGGADASTDPPSSTTHRAYELIARGLRARRQRAHPGGRGRLASPALPTAFPSSSQRCARRPVSRP